MKDAANSPTRFGPTALDSPKPYNATIVPSSPDPEDLTSSTESFRSAIKVSTTETVKVYRRKGQNEIKFRTCKGKVFTVTAICTAAGFCRAFKCHPFLLIVSPIFKTLIPVPSFAPKATTDTGGVPRI